MGLMVYSLGNVPEKTSRSHYIYLLDYGWQEPLANVLRDNFPRIAKLAEESGSVAIQGLDGIHFQNDVMSWHNINGVPGEDVLPAILVSTLNPHYFRCLPNDKSYIPHIEPALRAN